MTNPRTTDYLLKVRTYIRECEKIITRQKAAAARSGDDGSEADLTQKLLRWLEHMRATQVAELARVEKINAKSQHAQWPTHPAASGRLGKSRSRKFAQDDKWSFCLTAGTL